LSLVKDNIPADNHRFRRRIIAPPALVVRRVAKEDALEGLRLESLPLILLHMDICPTAKNANVVDRGLLPIPGFKWSLPR
jgi:hypothetical protein